ncbi:hypothetical protein TNCV_4230931 [Trichonephila clavipes]|uniref:Uncharacterized protein n=1 Tax=Trichonephila clavipes TaxID=2585209 RepID=A0A8X6SDL4_TRICX|nr:hypothetical protein TNCV_4230931 [Trichonephila clavipes]
MLCQARTSSPEALLVRAMGASREGVMLKQARDEEVESVSLARCNRRDETTLARFRSGYNRARRHVAGLKVYSPCLNSNGASPAHILACIGCHSRPTSMVAMTLGL